MLTNPILYGATTAFVTATWMYHGKRLEGSATFPPGTRIGVPMAFAAFRDPMPVPPPRSFVEKTFDVVHWTEMASRGHFAAWRAPERLLADLRAFVDRVSG